MAVLFRPYLRSGCVDVCPDSDQSFGRECERTQWLHWPVKIQSPQLHLVHDIIHHDAGCRHTARHSFRWEKGCMNQRHSGTAIFSPSGEEKVAWTKDTAALLFFLLQVRKRLHEQKTAALLFFRKQKWKTGKIISFALVVKITLVETAGSFTCCMSKYRGYFL